MKKTTIVLGLIFCSGLVFSKGGKDKSYYGQVVLNNEEIVQGDLTVDQAHQLVFVQKDEAIDTLQAAEIRSLNFKGKGGLQEFVTYDFPNRNNIPVPTMFRVVWTSGEIKLLERVVSSANTKIIYITNDEKRINKYLKVTEKESTVINKSLMQRMTRSYYRAVAQHAKDKKLDFSDQKDLIKILDYYLSLKS